MISIRLAVSSCAFLALFGQPGAFGTPLTDEEFEAAFKMVDSNGDGKLTKEQVKQLIRTSVCASVQMGLPEATKGGASFSTPLSLRASSYFSSASFEGIGGVGSSTREQGGGLGTLFGAARGPGDYHGTMSKAELEKEAIGAVFGGQGRGSQIENTRYEGRAYSPPPRVVDETEETRLFDSRSNSKIGEWVNGLGQSGSSSGLGHGSSEVEYISVDGSSGQGHGSVQGSSGLENADSGSNDSGWIRLPSGLWIRKEGWGESSWSSSSDSLEESGDQGSISSSGASWSQVSHTGEDRLLEVQRQLEEKARQVIDSIPTNVQQRNDTGLVTLEDGTLVENADSGLNDYYYYDYNYDYDSGSNDNDNDIPSNVEQRNDTGRVTLEDDTMVKKTSSWTSWSGVSHMGEELQEVHP